VDLILVAVMSLFMIFWHSSSSLTGLKLDLRPNNHLNDELDQDEDQKPPDLISWD